MRRKLVESRSEAKRAISEGLVRVGTAVDPKPSTLVSASDPIHVENPPEQFVSRGGRKLSGALDEFAIDVTDLRAIDVGASTGGFTDCLLQEGAKSVVALDVGHNQLHWRIRTDPRVTVLEHVNVRTADLSDLSTPFDIVVADLSFISLASVASVLGTLGGESAAWIVLIKPQFEVGKSLVGKGGIVRDPASHRKAVTDVVDAFEIEGLGCQQLTVSSITGMTGNVEFLAMFKRGDRVVTDSTIASVTDKGSE